MKEKYIISVDLDGTILNSNKCISNYTLDVLKKCQKLGFKIFINTSRSYLNTLELSVKMNADFVSCFNGNYIYSKKTIYKNSFSKNVFNSLINIIIRNKLEVIVECIDGTYRNKIEAYSFIDSNYFDFSKIKNNSCFKILIAKDDLVYFNYLIEKYNLVYEYDSINKIYRIMPSFSNKLNGLKYILNLLNFKYKTISFGDDISDLKTLKYSDIGIKMKNSSKSLDEIKFVTDDNDSDGVAKFLSNMFNFDMKTNYNNVKLLDCTLRDGGHLNNSFFGYENIIYIIKNLVKSNMDIIELGFLEDCVYNCDIARFNKVEDAYQLLDDIHFNGVYSLLTQVDKFDINKLSYCNGKIQMIRISFHKHLLKKALFFCKEVKKKGYICTLNPINFSGYSNLEVVELLKKVNNLDIDYFTVVDTFGTLTNNAFKNKLSLINRLLKKDISLALHLHDNLSSSFSTAQILMQENSRYNKIIIDCSLLGMGRDPGNLKTELIMYYLNDYKKCYQIKYIYKLIETVIKNYKDEYKWGHDFSYSISAFLKAHRSYAEYLKNKNIGYYDIDRIIKMIPDAYKDRYNLELIEKLYEEEICI